MQTWCQSRSARVHGGDADADTDGHAHNVLSTLAD
jgi:hypothetical protein